MVRELSQICMHGFSDLCEVPIPTWSTGEVLLLERAMEKQSRCQQDDPFIKAVDDALLRLWESCAACSADAIRLAILLLKTSRTGPPKWFALTLLEIAITDWWGIPDHDRKELIWQMNTMLRMMPGGSHKQQVQWTDRVTRVLRTIQELRLESQREPSAVSASPRRLRGSASLPGLIAEQTTKTDPLKVIGRRPQRKIAKWKIADQAVAPTTVWAAPRAIPFHQGQPVFKGSAQFQIQRGGNRSVGGRYFEEYQRNHASTF